MHLHFKHFSIIIASFFLMGCGGSKSSPSNDDPSTIDDSNTIDDSSIFHKADNAVIITKDTQVLNLGDKKEIQLTVDVGKHSKSIYLLLNNYSKKDSASFSITHNAKSSLSARKKQILPITKDDSIQTFHAPAHIQNFNIFAKKIIRKKNNSTSYHEKRIAAISKSNKSIGDSETFYMDEAANTKTIATLKKVVSNITTEFGKKRLNIWVSDDSFGYNCKKKKCVTQSIVDKMANQFLKEGENNDIYDWVTNIYGEEWGNDAATKYTNVINANDEITILLTDIGNDNTPTGGVIGYFYSKDNLVKSKVSGSNERIMFYADAVMFANDENDGFWQKEIYSTLAHEFQHMIHFYQKNILLDTLDDVWINEMLSEATEDLIATKIQHTGPRGVNPNIGSAGDKENTQGRYPLFNVYTSDPLPVWKNRMSDYSKVSAFGTFLVRNYGGAKVLHDIMYNKEKHKEAIQRATNKSFLSLVKEWGVAILLSDKEDLKDDCPIYNKGGFIFNTYKNITYKLGSINFFNYTPTPQINKESGEIKPHANYYYKVGDNLKEEIELNISLNGTTDAILIVK